MAIYSGSSTTATYADTWYEWNTAYDSGTTSTAVTSNTYVWKRWVTYQTTSSTAVTTRIWTEWVRREPNYEEVVENPVGQEVQELKYSYPDYDLIEKKRHEAEKKALDLLLDLVGKEQAEIYKKTGNLLVKGEQYDWLLNKEGKVFRVEKEKVIQFCVHSEKQHSQPLTDNVIALALHAKFAEKRLLEKANLVRERRDMLLLPEAANF